ILSFISFFFQAEDGIRDRNVTGVQTCALPISSGKAPVDVFKEQMLFLPLDKNREAVSGEVIVGGSSWPKIPHGINGKCPSIRPGDRKSTRLNSSHVSISYAVFCLKKKKNNNNI